MANKTPRAFLMEAMDLAVTQATQGKAKFQVEIGVGTFISLMSCAIEYWRNGYVHKLIFSMASKAIPPEQLYASKTYKTPTHSDVQDGNIRPHQRIATWWSTSVEHFTKLKQFCQPTTRSATNLAVLGVYICDSLSVQTCMNSGIQTIFFSHVSDDQVILKKQCDSAR